MDEETLREVEVLAEQLYGERPGDHEEARQRLICFNTPPYFGKAIFVLEQSENACALLMAGCAVGESVMSHWNSVSPDESITARNAILSVLWDKGSSFPPFASSAIIDALAKIVKLGWLDDARHQEVPAMIEKFLDSSAERQVLGLRILVSILGQMNKRYSGDTIARHRKIAISFRDTVLEKIFATSIAAINQMCGVRVENELQSLVKEDTLKLALACLEFDFIGTTPDDTGLDLGMVQIPNSWRSIFEDSAVPIVQLFFNTYAESQPDIAKIAMECLVMLASTRKSLFSSDSATLTFLTMLMNGMCNVLRDQTNLHHDGCHHDFCRLLARLRSNFQLAKLTLVPCFSDWTELVCNFTVTTFEAWQWAPNSLLYLLSVWAGLVRGGAFTNDGFERQVKECTPKVVGAFVSSRLQSVVATLEDGTIEDPLMDENQIKQQLESLAPIARCCYEVTADGIRAMLDPIATSLKDALTNRNFGMLPCLDGQLAWLVYVIGSVTGGRTPPVSEAQDTLDGELITRVFQLLQIHHQRLEQFPEMDKTDQLESFEMSLLHCLELFRRVYIGDQTLARSRVYSKLGEVVGLKTNLEVLEVVVQKLITNLNWWREERDVVRRSLDLFHDIAAGYNSGKLLVKLDIMNGILANHTVEHFNFLGYKDNLPSRTSFYTTLCRTLLMRENIEKFEEFMSPFDEVFQRLGTANSVEEMRNDDCRDLLIGLLRDLRGIVTACNQRASYLKFFEWIFPAYTPILHRVAEALHDIPEVTAVLLNFVHEMLSNKNNRLQFESCSPNSILLFKEMSKIVTTIALHLYEVDVKEVTDPFKYKYKGVKQCLSIMSRCLSGNYINFGVFSLYGDPCLQVSLGACLKLALSVPPSDLLAYPKLIKAYYVLVQALFKHHMVQLAELDTGSFGQLLDSILEGLTSTTMDVFHECCSSIDSLATFCFEYRRKETDTFLAIREHLSAGPNFFATALEVLFQVLLFVDTANHWSIARPMLSLILLDPEVYDQLTDRIIRTQPDDRQEKLHTAISKLMEGVHNNLLTANREKFTHNLTLFRHDVISFIVAT